MEGDVITPEILRHPNINVYVRPDIFYCETDGGEQLASYDVLVMSTVIRGSRVGQVKRYILHD